MLSYNQESDVIIYESVVAVRITQRLLSTIIYVTLRVYNNDVLEV